MDRELEGQMDRVYKFRAWLTLKKKWEYMTLESCCACDILLSRLEHWCQYTGLKDKNGKEIYEGDIVKWLGYEVSKGKQIYPEKIWEVTGEIQQLWEIKNIIASRGVEVIGNIYENPELLKEERP